ncbi:hypothetical protein EVAR_44192_1 [Eumeta japonica]|uniref:Uncharacterized protein n=1 Tax=Eumeta variegata TaxID=151549 RepID=A0A4C1W3B2_EUMVA|nr:hypothetical protein EVAR_44192_1 [Eumeta japonica]
MRTALTKVSCGTLDSVASTCDAPGTMSRRPNAQFGKPWTTFCPLLHPLSLVIRIEGQGLNYNKVRPGAMTWFVRDDIFFDILMPSTGLRYIRTASPSLGCITFRHLFQTNANDARLTVLYNHERTQTLWVATFQNKVALTTLHLNLQTLEGPDC